MAAGEDQPEPVVDDRALRSHDRVLLLIEAHELGEALRAIRHRAVAPQAVRCRRPLATSSPASSRLLVSSVQMGRSASRSASSPPSTSLAYSKSMYWAITPPFVGFVDTTQAGRGFGHTVGAWQSSSMRSTRSA